ncbi:MAG: AAA family ATPase [Bacteroidia bacterium]|nr:AAA family ATPase [Bacteroidia bacterium]
MRLHELHINNFKFFPKQDPNSPLLKIDGKNLLIYGENGSGKSTIYWAIYTLLESAFKVKNEDVSKYFEKGGKHGLVNIHASKRHNAYIKVVLKENGIPDVSYYIDGENATIESARANSAIRESGMASDFINYRVIFRLHNLKHSKENNLFSWFEDEIFPYILIASINSTKSVGDVLKELKEGPVKVKDFDEIDKMIFPNPAMQHHAEEAVRKDFKKYQKYERDLKKWNTKLKAYLQGIITRANTILTNDFQQNFEIKLDYTFARVNVTADDLGWKDPIIELKIPKYNGKRNVVKRPHTFLNEAKWTSIGLSIRLAIIEDWTNRPATAQLKALVIDDMLLSLDMSNRDIVLNLLLDRYVNDYQLIMLTHDRYFFELCKDKIQRKGQVNNWMNLEMYEDFDSATNKAKPFIIQDNGKVDKAWILFRSKDFSSAANMVRQATEKLCNYYLTNQEKLGRDYKPMKLDGLITKLIAKGTDAGLTAATLQDLKDYKDRIMNPNSHYDINQPLFRNELKNAIETLEKLKVEIGYFDL